MMQWQRLPRCYQGFDLNSRKIDTRVEQKVFNKKSSNKLDDTDIYAKREKAIDDLMKEKFPEPEFTCPDI